MVNVAEKLSPEYTQSISAYTDNNDIHFYENTSGNVRLENRLERIEFESLKNNSMANNYGQDIDLKNEIIGSTPLNFSSNILIKEMSSCLRPNETILDEKVNTPMIKRLLITFFEGNRSAMTEELSTNNYLPALFGTVITKYKNNKEAIKKLLLNNKNRDKIISEFLRFRQNTIIFIFKNYQNGNEEKIKITINKIDFEESNGNLNYVLKKSLTN